MEKYKKFPPTAQPHNNNNKREEGVPSGYYYYLLGARRIHYRYYIYTVEYKSDKARNIYAERRIGDEV